MTYITRECGHGKFLPTGEFRPLRENDHYLGIDGDWRRLKNEDAWPEGKNWEVALTHLNDWPDGPSYIILMMVEECLKGDLCGVVP